VIGRLYRAACFWRLSVAVIVLTLAPMEAWAECAWVLWKVPTGKFYQAGRAGELPRDAVPFELRNLPPRIEGGFPAYRECMAQPQAQQSEDGTFWTTRMTRGNNIEVLVGVSFQCLPDTVDPRGPKGGGR
jgi:hypothetical protein